MLIAALTMVATPTVAPAQDTSVDIYDLSVASPLVREAASSTAAMIPIKDLHDSEDGRIEIGYTPNFGRDLFLACPLFHYWYRERLRSAECTGFLTGRDLLMTAGHCLQGDAEDVCASYSWVFNYTSASIEDTSMVVDIEDVYGCKEVVSIDYPETTATNNLYQLESLLKNPDQYGRDFAFIRLDRPVEGKAPLRVRRSGKVGDGARLVAIGHPQGLPTKVSPLKAS